MRRRSIARPSAKVRGVARHLRALAAWSESFADRYPEVPAGDLWHEKLPVLDRLVRPPTADTAVQGEAVRHLLTAATALVRSRPPGCGSHVVTALVTHPDAFWSELCVFDSTDVLDRFLSRGRTLRPLSARTRDALSERLGVAVPAGFTEHGFAFRDDDSDAEGGDGVQEWWQYRCEASLPPVESPASESSA